MKNLYIDFDGVILDTLTYIYRDLEESGKTYTDEQRKKFYINYNWESVIKDEFIINDSINCIKKIIDSNKFNLAILTHVNSINEAVLKIKYLRKYFKDITIIPCPKEISKTQMIHTKDAILIDDYSGNLREWKKEGGIPVKFSLGVEPNEFIVIKKLDEILNLF
mgnify:FL=1